jgi:hypothetical protein
MGNQSTWRKTGPVPFYSAQIPHEVTLDRTWAAAVGPSFPKTEFYMQMLVKLPNIKLSRKSIQWERSCSMRTEGQTDRQTDRHDQTNSWFSQFL